MLLPDRVLDCCYRLESKLHNTGFEGSRKVSFWLEFSLVSIVEMIEDAGGTIARTMTGEIPPWAQARSGHVLALRTGNGSVTGLPAFKAGHVRRKHMPVAVQSYGVHSFHPYRRPKDPCPIILWALL